MATATAPEAAGTQKADIFGDAVELPVISRPKPKFELMLTDSSDSDEDLPLAQRKLSLAAARPQPAARPASQASRPPSQSSQRTDTKRKSTGTGGSIKKKARESDASTRPRRSEQAAPDAAEIRWTTLEHSGVLFPPEYQPHGVKMLYDGVPVDLTPEQEEVATFYAVMLETDYMTKETFKKNFWEGFSEVLGPKHAIQCLRKCDFTPIYEWHMAERERKRALTKEEKLRLKEEREAAEADYKFARVDGKQEQVGNFRVEPPGLFRGRGEHPKMGKIKKRIYPRDITINIGKGCPLPKHPFPGQTWREVRHDQTVTWLAYWRDPVNTKEYKYVFLAATSTWKSESDLLKYEKARKLKDSIADIRAEYTRNWDARDRRERQMATALYFIDKLALRAGHEKDEDEADTVGCCTLKVENVECLPPNHIKFDFLGKDSIRYENTVDVDPKVFQNLQLFSREDANGKAKQPGDQLFECFDAQDLNVRLKELMDGLSVKVFRTYNASIVLDRLLTGEVDSESVEAKKAAYDTANKEVAVLCNHQRAVPKGHVGQMEKLTAKMEALHAELAELQADLKLALKGLPGKDGRKLNAESLENRASKKQQQIEKAEINFKVKEDLKTVALGTSKINYLDPRITVAWCKRNEVPLERIFNRSLYQKFAWAMEVEPEYAF
ncbi:DNA topoisomerase 1 [Auxenochlorella protothecoides]|uniref:DNA topoisomerase I n=1 Tax=Auxenochlorella protothecoides TaxID=3075 RepID=A0A087SQ70_AUXPR|nr:DNA topoisomerase 1 [Auxenochlorella protothecoides]KFM27874.1 DNA topoisomerase 1 [Auxenochlorella protothecoides]